MRIAFLYVSLGLATAAAAQIPIPAFSNTYTFQHTRGFWFQAPTTFVITDVRVPNEATQPFQAVEIIDLGAAPPPAYPGTVTGTQLFYNNSTATSSLIPVNITIQSGAYIGVLGCCTPTQGSNTGYNSYGTPAGAFASNILGNPTTLTRFGTQFGIGAGGNMPCWQEPAGTISRVEVYVAPATGYASSAPYGTGCISVADVSSYENFATSGAFDLSNTSITMIRTGGTYLALPGITTFQPTTTATALALTDDSETTITLSGPMPVGATSSTTTLVVCSNGFVSAGTGNGTTYTPVPATFLNGSRAWWSGCWHDYNPAIAGSGQVKWEEVAGVVYITWDGVWDYGGTTAANANTFQMQFEIATGTVHYLYQTMSTLGNGRLVGFSDAGASADPGSMDISAALPTTYIAAVFTVVPLAHSTSARPVIGTTPNLLASNVPSGALIGLMILGTTEYTTGIDLTFLGMPTCNLYASLDVMLSFLPAGSTGSVPFVIPANPALAGLIILTQATAWVPGINPFGFITSNGMRLTLDLL